VRSGSQELSVEVVTCGVPQGSVLGLLLFISYSDDVSRVIKYCRLHIYADCLQFYHTCAVSDFHRCIDELNLDLQRMHEYAAANCLRLNPMKSQVIVISRCKVHSFSEDHVSHLIEGKCYGRFAGSLCLMSGFRFCGFFTNEQGERDTIIK
jgi:hypothetical protein